jgi:curli production assembly/transport component CsgE
MRIALAIILALLLHAARAQPPNGENPMRPAPAMDPYVGFIVDSTVTHIGADFYRSFVSAWRDQAPEDRYSLGVLERPSARWGSLIYVEYRGRRVFNAFLSPGRRDEVRVRGREAARQVYEAVVQAELQRLLFREADLAPEEL